MGLKIWKAYDVKGMMGDRIEGKNLILVENSTTGMLAGIIAEKTGIFIYDKNKILRFDWCPFFVDELGEEIRRRVK